MGMSGYCDLVICDLLAPLGNAAQPLLALSERERQDARILALVAQKDPVFLARLLGPVNAVAQAVPIRTAEEAVRVLGTSEAYALLKQCADASTRLRRISSEVRRYLLVQAVSLALTIRRIGLLLKLPTEQRIRLSLAALFDTLGLYALLVTEHAQRDAVEAGLLQRAKTRSPLPQQADWMQGYEYAGAQLARRWGAPVEVPDIILGSSIPLHANSPSLSRVLALSQELVAARLTQQHHEDEEVAASPLMREFGLQSSALSDRVLDLAFIGF